MHAHTLSRLLRFSRGSSMDRKCSCLYVLIASLGERANVNQLPAAAAPTFCRPPNLRSETISSQLFHLFPPPSPSPWRRLLGSSVSRCLYCMQVVQHGKRRRFDSTGMSRFGRWRSVASEIQIVSRPSADMAIAMLGYHVQQGILSMRQGSRSFLFTRSVLPLN